MTKKCKIKKVKEEKILPSIVPPTIPLNPSPSENKNPNESKQLSYSEVIQEANKLLAADEPMTPINSSASVPLTNPATTRLTKPIATVSPLHTSKNNQNRVIEKPDEDQLIDLSKSNVTAYVETLSISSFSLHSSFSRTDIPVKSETKKRSRQGSSSTTRTKISRRSNKSTTDEGNESSKSLKKTLSSIIPNQFLPPPPPPPPTSSHPSQQQQHMFQNLFHSFQNPANYWTMSPWAVPPSLALMTDPRNYYAQPWHPPPPSQSPVIHGPKDLSSASLNDFIAETSTSGFPLPPSSALANFTRTPSSNSLHMTNRHRPTPLNGTLS